MSSFIVDTECMSNVVTGILLHSNTFGNRAWRGTENALALDAIGTEIGAELFKLNEQAFAARYEGRHAEDGKAPAFAYQFPVLSRAQYVARRVQDYKSLQCFLYQCSEGDVYKSEPFERVREIGTKMAARIVEALPEYEAASW